MKIAIAADHGGFELKEKIKKYVGEVMGYEVADFGANSADSVDYPDFAREVARRISSGEFPRGILICGSGIGMCMAANRYKNVRAAVLRDVPDAKMSRLHNDSNVACLGGRVTSAGEAERLLDVWFNTPFEGGRHARRIAKIEHPI